MEVKLLRIDRTVVFYRYLGRGRVFKSLCHIWEVWCEQEDGQLATLSSCFPVRYGFYRSEREVRRDATAFARSRVLPPETQA
ncbi:hypothetical protein [Gloeobacter violaceus]|uniref:Gsr0927 protein n=1 Tax=Gloeobacter violaceus (strain ATCC 29082 / PCC 7421) TaxID=251221 RepID=Q7NM42_GLOVI|nr:hypothetical protein [Gloeobacter violaceus]BAC88868.1 gsr0927 [Gloeobacter violaceus PCC 7421]